MHSKKHSMAKSLVWRFLGVVCLWIISFIFTGSIPKASYITAAHHTAFVFIYWMHERAWLRRSDFRLKALLKAYTYEIMIAVPVLTVISWLFTGDPWRALAISVNYTVFKLFLYVVYEKSWNRKFPQKKA